MLIRRGFPKNITFYRSFVARSIDVKQPPSKAVAPPVTTVEQLIFHASARHETRNAAPVRSDMAGRYDEWFAVECQGINPFFQKIAGSRLEENVIGPRIDYFANQFGCGIPSHNYNRKKGIGSGF